MHQVIFLAGPSQVPRALVAVPSLVLRTELTTARRRTRLGRQCTARRIVSRTLTELFEVCKPAGYLRVQSVAHGQLLAKRPRLRANMLSPSMLDRDSRCLFVISVRSGSCRMSHVVCNGQTLSIAFWLESIVLILRVGNSIVPFWFFKDRNQIKTTYVSTPKIKNKFKRNTFKSSENTSQNWSKIAMAAACFSNMFKVHSASFFELVTVQTVPTLLQSFPKLHLWTCNPCNLFQSCCNLFQSCCNLLQSCCNLFQRCCNLFQSCCILF